jgi:hypothetical protein
MAALRPVPHRVEGGVERSNVTRLESLGCPLREDGGGSCRPPDILEVLLRPTRVRSRILCADGSATTIAGGDPRRVPGLASNAIRHIDT